MPEGHENKNAQHQNSPTNLCGRAIGLNRLLTVPPEEYLLLPALLNAMATACSCGFPAAISVLMFWLITAFDLPVLSGISLLHRLTLHFNSLQVYIISVVCNLLL
jgi:hypothetical protein